MHDAKVVILDELERIRRRSTARHCVDDVLDRTGLRKKVMATCPDERRSGVLAAREHLRQLGLHSELTDQVLRGLWCA